MGVQPAPRPSRRLPVTGSPNRSYGWKADGWNFKHPVASLELHSHIVGVRNRTGRTPGKRDSADVVGDLDHAAADLGGHGAVRLIDGLRVAMEMNTVSILVGTFVSAAPAARS